MPASFQRAFPPARPPEGPAAWFMFQNGAQFVREEAGGLTLIGAEDADIAPLLVRAPLFMGTLDGRPCMAGELAADAAPLPPDWQAVSIRALFGQLGEAAYAVTLYALHILNWQRASQHCPLCGAPMGDLAAQWSRCCTRCDHTGHPPVTPAILALVHDGDRVLLTHRSGRHAIYTIVAGFVEPGESLEGCVQREVLEEVNVAVGDVTFVGSQPWPFPNQLMVGFQARYVGGEIRPDQIELDEARWYRFDELPELPPPASLARQMIDAWAQSRRAGRTIVG